MHHRWTPCVSDFDQQQCGTLGRTILTKTFTNYQSPIRPTCNAWREVILLQNNGSENNLSSQVRTVILLHTGNLSRDHIKIESSKF